MTHDDNPPSELPAGWAWTTLGDITFPARPKIPADPASNVPFLGLDSIEPDGLHPIHVGRFGDMKSAASAFREGDVLYGRLRPYLNKVWRAEYSGAASAEFIVFPANEFIDSDFLKYLLHDRRFVNFASHLVSGDRPRIDAAEIAQYGIALPPAAEQRRIATHLDELSGEIDAGEQELEKARQGLETYRRAVLKAAVTGELTKEWRTKCALGESGEDLLNRLLADQRRHSKAAVAFEIGDFAQLPDGWIWASLGQLCWSSSYGTSEKCRVDAVGPAVLRIPNIQRGTIDFSNLKFAHRELTIDERNLVRPGDFLVVRTNGSENLIGRSAVVRSELSVPSYFASYLIRFRLCGDHDLWRWIGFYWDSHIVRKLVKKHAATSAGQYNISQSNLLRFPVPIPSALELHELVNRAEELLQAADALDTVLEKGVPVSELRQSVHSAAFSGKLTAQTPDDEPAFKLLERLRQANASTSSIRERNAKKSNRRRV